MEIQIGWEWWYQAFDTVYLSHVVMQCVSFAIILWQNNADSPVHFIKKKRINLIQKKTLKIFLTPSACAPEKIRDSTWHHVNLTVATSDLCLT